MTNISKQTKYVKTVSETRAGKLREIYDVKPKIERAVNLTRPKPSAYQQFRAKPKLDNITVIAEADIQALSKKASDYERFINMRSWLYEQKQNIHKIINQSESSNRVTYCGKALDAGGVPLNLTPEKKAFFGLIARCGNRWLCPTCSAKASAGMGAKLITAFTNYQKKKYHLHFITLTVLHTKKDRLNDLMQNMSAVWRKLGKSLKAFKDVNEYFMTLEIKYNQKTGWHPHFHILTVQKTKDIKPLKSIVKNWVQLNTNSSLKAQNIKQATNKELSNYITKSGLSYELTSSQNKVSESYHPFELIELGEIDAFKEYMKATYRRKMNYWSRGFWASATIEKFTENELIDEGEKIEISLGKFEKNLWEYMRKNVSLGRVLQLAENEKTVSEIIDIMNIKVPVSTGKDITTDYQLKPSTNF